MQYIYRREYNSSHPIYSHYTRVNSVNYHGQKSMAIKRGISWEFTLYTWIEWWVNTGHFHQRGVNNNDYQMCRYNDIGSYSPLNVYCDTGENNKRAIRRTKKLRPVKAYKRCRAVIIATNKSNGKQYRYEGYRALKAAGFDTTAVSRCIAGSRKSHKGHKFAYE